LDIDERCLTFRDKPVSLTPKALQTLVVLLRNHGKVVEKEYFPHQVWAESFGLRTIQRASFEKPITEY
jgi:DNA-binding winged helix-turn-helix (wHTH) protein